MLREIVTSEPAQVDDLSHTGLARGSAERERSGPVGLVERAARAHRVNQVVDGVDADEGWGDGVRLQHIAANDLGRRGDSWPQVLGAAGEAADALTAILERMA